MQTSTFNAFNTTDKTLLTYSAYKRLWIKNCENFFSEKINLAHQMELYLSPLDFFDKSIW